MIDHISFADLHHDFSNKLNRKCLEVQHDNPRLLIMIPGKCFSLNLLLKDCYDE